MRPAPSFPSPFEEAAILTLDGVGEWDTATIGSGKGNKIKLLKTLHFPHSLGPALQRVHLLLRVQGQLRRIQAHGPGALRRAALRGPHPGEARALQEDGSLAMDLRYFDYCAGLTMTR
jgi:carbamoyltransferase